MLAADWWSTVGGSTIRSKKSPGLCSPGDRNSYFRTSLRLQLPADVLEHVGRQVEVEQRPEILADEWFQQGVRRQGRIPVTDPRADLDRLRREHKKRPGESPGLDTAGYLLLRSAQGMLAPAAQL